MNLIEQNEFSSADFSQEFIPWGQHLGIDGTYAIVGILNAGCGVTPLEGNCTTLLRHFALRECRASWSATFRACETICLHDEGEIDADEANKRLALSIAEIRAKMPKPKSHLRVIEGGAS